MIMFTHTCLTAPNHCGGVVEHLDSSAYATAMTAIRKKIRQLFIVYYDKYYTQANEGKILALYK